MKLSSIINKIHSILIVYFLFGFTIQSQREILLLLLPLLQYQFLINDNMCILTQLENKLKKKEGTIEIGNSFIDSKLKKLNIKISENTREKIIHTSVISSFFINYLLLFSKII